MKPPDREGIVKQETIDTFFDLVVLPAVIWLGYKALTRPRR